MGRYMGSCFFVVAVGLTGTLSKLCAGGYLGITGAGFFAVGIIPLCTMLKHITNGINICESRYIMSQKLLVPNGWLQGCDIPSLVSRCIVKRWLASIPRFLVCFQNVI